MDIDLIIIILLIILTIVFFRKFSNVVYIICILDIFLRLLDIIERMLGVPEFSALVNKYFHNSIYHIIVLKFYHLQHNQKSCSYHLQSL